ncbi:prepilin-type N-terminal cleavage/methylation domain-containing protein [Myxococcaceae bacterium GXIMD 01537]
MSAPTARRPATRRRGSRGLTLIEIAIALLIAAVLFSAVVVSVGALTGSKARAAAGELAGTIRSIYDTASLSGKTCRLVFELPPEKSEEAVHYHAECAAQGVTTERNREDALKSDNREREQAAKQQGRDERRNFTRSDNGAPSLQSLMAEEKERIDSAARYSAYTNPEIAPRELPEGVEVSIWTRHQRQAVEHGVAYLYFFPQGYTERAHVQVRQGDNVWTLDISPLTGKVNIVPEALEVPR